MSVPNTTTLEAAEEILFDSNVEEFKREMTFEGIYTAVVEGGYHEQALTDEEADFLSDRLAEGGVTGLMAYVLCEKNEDDNIAYIKPLVSTTGASVEEMISRLDDGNNYPGFTLEYDLNQSLFILKDND